MIIGEKCRLYLFSLTVPVIVPVAQFTHKNQITVSTQEQKSSQCTKKESPVYPPGKRGGCSGYMKMIQTPILNIFEYSKKRFRDAFLYRKSGREMAAADFGQG